MKNNLSLKLNKINISGIESFKGYQSNGLNYFVYYLQDPFTFEICYIGKTNDPVGRYSQHCNRYSFKGNGRLYLWVDYLASNNQKPLITFIWHLKGYPSDKVIRKIETWEIRRHWNLGHPLLNQTLKKKAGRSARIESSRYWSLVKESFKHDIGFQGTAGERGP